MMKYGYRKDFNWETRLDLKTDIDFGTGVVTVSTVDLGLNQNLLGGRPIYYETAVFGDIDWESIDFPQGESTVVERYHTEEEAVEGHEQYVEMLRELANK